MKELILAADAKKDLGKLPVKFLITTVNQYLQSHPQYKIFNQEINDYAEIQFDLLMKDAQSVAGLKYMNQLEIDKKMAKKRKMEQLEEYSRLKLQEEMNQQKSLKEAEFILQEKMRQDQEEQVEKRVKEAEILLVKKLTQEEEKTKIAECPEFEPVNRGSGSYLFDCQQYLGIFYVIL